MTEKPKRVMTNRLTHDKAYKLIEWLKTNSEILKTLPKKILVVKASEELGFPIEADSMAMLAKKVGIEVGIPRAPRGSKKKLSNKLNQQQEILIARKWIEVILRKIFNNPAEATMAWRELYGHFGPDSSAAKEQPPLQ